MMAGRGGATPDFAAMIERMPAAKVEDLTTGQTIIVTSTKGVNSEEMTAITVLANADGLIRNGYDDVSSREERALAPWVQGPL